MHHPGSGRGRDETGGERVHMAEFPAARRNVAGVRHGRGKLQRRRRLRDDVLAFFGSFILKRFDRFDVSTL